MVKLWKKVERLEIDSAKQQVMQMEVNNIDEEIIRLEGETDHLIKQVDDNTKTIGEVKDEQIRRKHSVYRIR